MDLFIRRARLVHGGTVNLMVRDGVIAAIGEDLRPAPGSVEHDLDGMLLLPALVEPHAHLDKALSADAVANPSGDLLGAIESMEAAVRDGRFAVDEVAGRARLAIGQLVGNGVTLIRTHADVAADIGVTRIEALRQVRDEFAGLVEIEIVALGSCPLTGPDGAANRAALVAALEAGADLVGACPHLDPDPNGVIDLVFDAATEAGLPIDLHTDETLDPAMMTLPYLAETRERRGFGLPVTASHCVSLSMQPLARQHEIARRIAAADIAVIPLPATNLYLQARGVAAGSPRGIAPVNVLREHGVRVAAGGDNVQDPFNPVGRGDQLDTAGLLVLAAHQLPDDAFELVSNAARVVLGRSAVQLVPGAPADFLAVAAPTIRHVVAGDVSERRVVHRGRLVATSHSATTLHR